MRQPALDSVATAGSSPWARLLVFARLERRELAVLFVLASGLGLLSLAVPVTAQAVIRTVAIGSLRQPLIVLGSVLTLGLLFALALEVAQLIAVESVSRRLFLRVVDDFAERMVGLDREQVRQSLAATRVRRFFDVALMEKAVTSWLFDGLAAVLRIAVGMALLAIYHPWLLVLDIALAVGLFFVLGVLGRGALTAAIVESKQKYALAHWLESLAEDDGGHFAGQGAGQAATRTQDLATRWLGARKRHFNALMRQVGGMLLLQVLVSVAVLVLGGFLVLEGELDLGQLVAAELVTAASVSALGKLGKLLGKGYDLLAAVDKIGSVVDLPVACAGEDLPHQGPLPVRIGEGGDWPAMALSAGDRAVLYDRQRGRGSVLVAELTGYAAPRRGELLVAETDVADLDRDALADRVRRIRPRPLATGTVGELMGPHLRPGCRIAELRAALAEVGLAGRVDRLPEGLDTQIDRDGPLTAEERVLLDVASARLTRPGLVVVDGALDLLDDSSRDAAMAVLCAEDAPWTLLVRTSRPEIAGRFDRVTRLEPVREVA